jgi:hypothetical protein
VANTDAIAAVSIEVESVFTLAPRQAGPRIPDRIEMVARDGEG